MSRLTPSQGLLDFAADTDSQRPYYFAEEQVMVAGRWFVLHHTAGGGTAVDCDCPSEHAARQECGRMNDERVKVRRRLEQEWAAKQVEAVDRPIPQGFYTDKDAA